MMTEFAWIPGADVIAGARLTEFLAFTGVQDVTTLYGRSIADVAWFTDQVIRFLGIVFDREYDQVLDRSNGPEWPRWCVGGRINIARSCLRHPGEGLAVLLETESGESERLSYRELSTAVKSLAATFKNYGISKGDRVGVYMPMRTETVVTMLSLAWVGAIAVPLFSGYGPAAISARLNQTGAVALITCAAFMHGGKRIDLLDHASAALERCPASTRLIVLPRESVTTSDDADPELMEAEDPLLILFSSGTMGEPKGIVHSHCSFPIKAAQDMALQMDVHTGDRIAWITDLGWMMGPWLIYGALILGATVVLRQGACDWPAADALWCFADRTRLDVLGVSPSLVRRLAEHGMPQTADCDLTGLRFFASSGEPWDPASWQWLFRQVREKPVPIINYSGGTEISGGILSNHPLAPMKACGLSAPCFGIAADIVDGTGRSIDAGTGELVIREPWIGQARGFWRAPERYLDSYWSRVPGLWIHGDWAERDRDGQWFILGRSDDTLKIAGKRVGPAEVEAILAAHPAVIEAAVIGVPHPQKGTALVAVCVAREVSGLAALLSDHAARELGKPLRPEHVCFVSALPKTRNGKTVRRLIRAAYLGEPPGDLSAIENPAALEEIRLQAKEV